MRRQALEDVGDVRPDPDAYFVNLDLIGFTKATTGADYPDGRCYNQYLRELLEA